MDPIYNSNKEYEITRNDKKMRNVDLRRKMQDYWESIYKIFY